MKSILIRRATRRDAAIFLKLVDELADYEKLKRPTRAARARLLRDGFGRNRRFDPFLAFVKGAAVGYAIVFETYSSLRAQPTLYLEDLFILESHRKQGVGFALFRKCVDEAHRRGCGRMEWVVLDWNKIAIDFYNRIGAHHLNNWLTYRLDREQFGDILNM